MNFLKNKDKNIDIGQKKVPNEFKYMLIFIIVVFALIISLPSMWGLFKLHQQTSIQNKLNTLSSDVGVIGTPNNTLASYKDELIDISKSYWITPSEKEQALKLSAIATVTEDLNNLTTNSNNLKYELNKVLPTMNKEEIYKVLPKVWDFVAGKDFSKAESDIQLAQMFGYWGPSKEDLLNSYAQPLFNLINANPVANPK